MQLTNKIIAITGAAQGLGRAMALQLAATGAKLALIDMNLDKLKETLALVEQAGASGACFTANVADENSVATVFKNISEQMGPLTGLINNAGITRDGFMIKAKNAVIEKRLSLSEWQAVIDVNLTGVFLCAREASTIMIETKQPGVIINISSISRAGNMGQTNYTAAKAGVAAMTVTWAKELARYNIRVGAIAPGFIETDLVKNMKPEALDKIKSGIPLGRLGQPEEIAHAVRFIFENDYFTGRVLEIDGGLRL